MRGGLLRLITSCNVINLPRHLAPLDCRSNDIAQRRGVIAFPFLFFLFHCIRKSITPDLSRTLHFARFFTVKETPTQTDQTYERDGGGCHYAAMIFPEGRAQRKRAWQIGLWVVRIFRCVVVRSLHQLNQRGCATFVPPPGGSPNSPGCNWKPCARIIRRKRSRWVRQMIKRGEREKL